MGLISKIKSFFLKNIECGDEIDSELVYLYPSKKGINLGVNIVVKTGFIACLVVGNKVHDVIYAGKHRLDAAIIPNTFKKLKLGVPNKKGNLPSKFNADLYFVNMQQFEGFEFESPTPFIFKTEEFGKVKGYIEGECMFQITDATTLLNYFLSERPKIKSKYVIFGVSDCLGNVVTRIVEKSNLKFTDLLTNPKIVYSEVNASAADEISNLGVTVKNVKLTSLKMKKKYQEKINEYFDKTKQESTPVVENDNSALKEMLKGSIFEGLAEEQEKINSLNQSQNQSQENNASTQNINNTEVFARRRTTNLDVLLNNVNSVNTANNVNNNSAGASSGGASSAPTQTAGTINANETLNNKDFKKVCKYCGALIDSSFAFCPKCGYKQE